MSDIERDHVEREVKLDVDSRFEVPSLEGASPLEARRLDAVYHDTLDLQLLDQGITVRRRSGEGTRWTVKFPSAEVAAAGGLARREARQCGSGEACDGRLVDRERDGGAGDFLSGGRDHGTRQL